ncbi:12666_t:CDS:2 [Entrophospora sp. SA101]|nr:12666_t:CDS:2 [Entrophospora sp. SA101]
MHKLSHLRRRGLPADAIGEISEDEEEPTTRKEVDLSDDEDEYHSGFEANSSSDEDSDINSENSQSDFENEDKNSLNLKHSSNPVGSNNNGHNEEASNKTILTKNRKNSNSNLQNNCLDTDEIHKTDSNIVDDESEHDNNHNQSTKTTQTRQDYRKKLAEDPSYVPKFGYFWGHDDRFVKEEAENLQDNNNKFRKFPSSNNYRHDNNYYHRYDNNHRHNNNYRHANGNNYNHKNKSASYDEDFNDDDVVKKKEPLQNDISPLKDEAVEKKDAINELEIASNEEDAPEITTCIHQEKEIDNVEQKEMKNTNMKSIESKNNASTQPVEPSTTSTASSSKRYSSRRVVTTLPQTNTNSEDKPDSPKSPTENNTNEPQHKLSELPHTAVFARPFKPKSAIVNEEKIHSPDENNLNVVNSNYIPPQLNKVMLPYYPINNVPFTPIGLADNSIKTKLILRATKQIDIDEPALFIQLDNNGFNDTAVLNCRNGVLGQTQYALIVYIVGCGGVNFRGLNTLFLFRNNLAIFHCQYGFPLWTRYQMGIVYFLPFSL